MGLKDVAATGLNAVGSIFGGISASHAVKKAKKRTEGLREANQNWYDRRYNEDDTQRADAQAMLTKVRDDIRNRNRQAAGTQAIMGGTQESTAAAKAANNEALAQTASNIASSAANRKDNIEQTAMKNEADYVAQLNEYDLKRANATSQAITGVNKAVNSALTGDLETGDGGMTVTTDAQGNIVIKKNS